MNTFHRKSGKCRNDKNGPLKNVHFFLEKTLEPPLNVVLSGPECLCRMFIIPQGKKGSRPGGSPFSIGEEKTFSDCECFPRKKREATREGTGT